MVTVEMLLTIFFTRLPELNIAVPLMFGYPKLNLNFYFDLFNA